MTADWQNISHMANSFIWKTLIMSNTGNIENICKKILEPCITHGSSVLDPNNSELMMFDCNNYDCEIKGLPKWNLFSFENK